MLHIVNKSPYERSSISSCLRHAAPGAAVLLIEDAVYAATRDSVAERELKDALAQQVAIYALGPDVEARGMQDRLLEGVQVVDYGGFVDLVAGHRTNQSWL